ncbi:hypothetical protein ACFPA8_16880 [Streptomyces ovatisporus]|uniref:Uncharacterized protein n=1 Tax=Streptomyces ovatisporus TaxID=1128682 RepID=A0ABV9A9Y5_9ACTN
MEIYVIDTHAALALPELCRDVEDRHLFFNTFTEMIRGGTLAFPELVVKDCQQFASGEYIYTWINAAAGHRTCKAVKSHWQEEVLGVCPEILDQDSEMEQTPVLVASMALMLSDDLLTDVYVVTEDRLEVPERKCLAMACQDLELETMTARELAIKASLDEYI